MHTQKRNLSEFDMSAQSAVPELDAGQPGGELPTGEIDREGAMAKADLYKLANYAHKLFEKIQDDDQLEAWVQAKITKAADYMASVYHYMEYEMKFSEYGHHLDNSDTLSEGQKRALKGKLMEAKEKVKALKRAQADKVKESSDFGDETSAEKKERVAKEKDDAAKSKKSSTGGSTTSKDGKTVHKSGKFYEAAEDEDFGKETAAEKKERVAKEKDDAAKSKKSSTGGSTSASGGKTVHKAGKFYEDTEEDSFGKETAAEKKDRLAKEKSKESGPKKSSTGGTTTASGGKTVHKAGKNYSGGVSETLKGKQKVLDQDKDGDIEADDLAALRAKNVKSKTVQETKPSAGLSKKEKSAVVKKAVAGKDIGKPGKGFAKVEKAAAKSGAKDPKAVAAAAMWKNVKEATKVAEAAKKVIPAAPAKETSKKNPLQQAVVNKNEVVKESTDLNRMKQLLTRLNG